MDNHSPRYSKHELRLIMQRFRRASDKHRRRASLQYARAYTQIATILQNTFDL